LNDLSDTPDDPLVEVIVLSRNDPDTGLRVMRSINSHELSITRAILMQGRSPYKFMPALNMSLFLSADARDVREAVAMSLPAGRVLDSSFVDDEAGDLRIAFDFDGVLADDEAERLYQTRGLDEFRQHELENAVAPHTPGPLHAFLANINKIQRIELQRRQADRDYRIRVHVSIVTARDAPAHERAIWSLKSWGVTVNDAFFLGGIDKGRILEVLKPHIFFDDQEGHLQAAARSTPSVHVPFGVVNEPRNCARPDQI
jgi:5'-nucleotidase